MSLEKLKKGLADLVHGPFRHFEEVLFSLGRGALKKNKLLIVKEPLAL